MNMHGSKSPPSRPIAATPPVLPNPATPPGCSSAPLGPLSRQLDQVLRQADTYYARGQFEVARDFLAVAHQMATGSVEILSGLGSLEYQLRNFQAAREAFEKAARIDPRDAAVQTKLAAASLECGQTDTFETAVILALDLNPHDTDAWRLLGRYLLSQNRFLQSARVYQRLLQILPDDVVGLLGLGKCFFALHDFPAAQLVFDRVLALEPGNAVAAENRAVVKQKHNPQQSCAAPQPVESDAADVMMALPAALSGASLGADQRAAAPVSPELAALLDQAETAYAQGNLLAAREALRQAAALGHDRVDLIETLGSLEYQLGAFKLAQSAFEHAIELAPHVAAFHIKRAAACQQLRDADGFELSVTQALALSADDPDAFKLIANQRSLEGRHLEAARCCLKVLETRRHDVDTLLLLANSLYHAGDLTTALEAYEEVLKVDPQHETAVANCSFIRQKLVLDTAAPAPAVSHSVPELAIVGSLV